MFGTLFAPSALSRRSLFEAKDESRKKAAESEKAKEAAVEEAVTRVKRQVEESMSETYRYKASLLVLALGQHERCGTPSLERSRR